MGRRVVECTGGEVSERLAVRMGLSAQMVGHVLACGADVVVAALAATVAQGRGAATRVFGTLVSQECDAHIGSGCGERVSTTAGLVALGHEGEALLVRATGREVAALGDHVAARCGIPAQAAHMLVCVSAAVVGGLLKYHILLGQGEAAQLPGLLAGQLPLVAGSLGDGVAAALGCATAAAFMATVPVRLAAVAADFPGPEESVPGGAVPVPGGGLQAAAGPVEPVVAPAGPVPVHTDYAGALRYAGLPVQRGAAGVPAPAAAAAAAPAAAVPAGAQAGPDARAGRRAARPWLLVLVAAAVLGGLFAWAKLQPPQEGGAGSAAPATPGEVHPAPVTPAAAPGAASAVPGSGVPAAAPSTSSAPSGAGSAPAAASAAAAASAVPAAGVAQAADGGWLDARSSAAGVPAVEARVGDGAQRAALEAAVNAGPGAGHLAVTVLPQAGAGTPPWLPRVDALLAVLAVPGAEVSARGRQVWLGGLSAQQGEDWRTRLQQGLGPSFTVEVFDPVAQQAQATDAFLRAMAALLQTDHPCAAPAAVAVLNLQHIDFGASSGHVPATAQQDLSESAQLLRACAARGQALHLSVQAWTDRRGDLQANLALSRKRAEAVRAFLVGAGVAAATLAAQGYGAAEPVAGNLTAAGRFANRRIRFTAVQP